MEIERLQNILKNKSTTFVRKVFDTYCKDMKYAKGYKTDKKWYCSQFDCKHRFRTNCMFNDGEHGLNIVLRKKAGYYFLIEYDGKRIFECDPSIIVLEKDMLDYVIKKYENLFEALVA